MLLVTHGFTALAITAIHTHDRHAVMRLSMSWPRKPQGEFATLLLISTAALRATYRIRTDDLLFTRQLL